MCWMTVAYVAFIFRSHLAKAVDFRCTPCGEGVLCPVGSSIAGLLNSTGNPNEPRVVNGYSSEQSLPLETCSSICFRSYFYLSFLIICMYNIYFSIFDMFIIFFRSCFWGTAVWSLPVLVDLQEPAVEAALAQPAAGALQMSSSQRCHAMLQLWIVRNT